MEFSPMTNFPERSGCIHTLFFGFFVVGCCCCLFTQKKTLKSLFDSNRYSKIGYLFMLAAWIMYLIIAPVFTFTAVNMCRIITPIKLQNLTFLSKLVSKFRTIGGENIWKKRH